MSSNQKRGFRLPWGAEQGSEQGSEPSFEPSSEPGPEPGGSLLAPAGERTAAAMSDDLGAGPFQLAGSAQSTTTDAAPAAANLADATSEAAMIDADAPRPDSASGSPDELMEARGGWPVSDRRGPERPFVTEPRMPRRDNPLVAGLIKAMREAAVASREETTTRLSAEATARMETIRARATTEAAGLRKRADEDVSAIREWSKAEMARVRQATDDRIEARRVELAGETERHAASVDRLVGEVQTTVAAFEADMDRFFTHLLAESDPARLATLAEQAPDPPDLRGDGPPATDFMNEPEAGLHSDAAAEAEAAATEGLDPAAAEAWPTAVATAVRKGDPVSSPADANGPDATRLLVSGLHSVAAISAFKGALGQLAGVRSVSVSSGAKGVFVFAVNHDPGVDLDSGVASLPGFAAQITDATNDGFTVVAREPAA